VEVTFSPEGAKRSVTQIEAPAPEDQLLGDVIVGRHLLSMKSKYLNLLSNRQPLDDVRNHCRRSYVDIELLIFAALEN